MGVKLYPPIIENTLPACWMDSKGMVQITIPFTMNRSVASGEISGFNIKIKTVQTGSYLTTYSIRDTGSYVINGINGTISIQTDGENIFKIGQFYKLQISYLSQDGTEGFYSTAGTFKCTSKPNIYINNFNVNKLNLYSHNYTGYYDQTNGDTTEKVYSYQFNLFNEKNEIVYSSNECIHNGLNDDANGLGLSYDTFYVPIDIDRDKIYYIQYMVTTINSLTISSPKYKILLTDTLDAEIHASLKAISNFDNGYIDLELIPENDTVLDTGAFVIARADKNSNYTNWEDLHTFKLYRKNPKGFIFRDYTFQQGRFYKYSIQQYNDYDLYSNRLLSNEIYGDFEDGFLYDGKRQLKIRYNMKMSKLSTHILEAKQETIGSQYPFFFKNGIVNYHEFPINGLISYSMDEARLFLSEEDLDLPNNLYRRHTASQDTQAQLKDSLGEEIFRERLFKQEVSDWLTNGEPKILRTPTEGNFIVRLTKVSLSPEDKLGRMLHSFSCTACEIAEYNSNNLQKYNLLDFSEPVIKIPQVLTVDLNGASVSKTVNINTPQNASIISLHFDGMFPGDLVKLSFADASTKIIQIGRTGDYHLDDVELNLKKITFTPRYRIINITEDEYEDSETTFYTLKAGKYTKYTGDYDDKEQYYVVSNPTLIGTITYVYLVNSSNNFSQIQSLSYNNSNIRQFIGQFDLLKQITNAKTELIDISYIKAIKRPIDLMVSEYVTSTEDNGEYYYGVKQANGNASERLPKIELLYPIGLRAYEPQTYYTKTNNSYSKETNPNSTWDSNKTYYLKGRYINTTAPIGQRAFDPTRLYILTPSGEYELATQWEHKKQYYEQHTTLKGQVYYEPVYYVTADAAHVFKDNTFYKIAHTTKVNGVSTPFYTLARKFYPEFYNNWKANGSYKGYFELDDSYDEYVDAYVTIDRNHVYSPFTYYIHVTEPGETDEYHLCTALEFNTHNLTLKTTETLEYEKYVLKYYKLRDTLPHTLYAIANEWEEDKTRTGYGGGSFYHIPQESIIKYKDLYNNRDFAAEDYDPHIRINNKAISVEDSIVFGPKDLSNFGPITDLRSGNGVIVELVYSTRDIEYLAENDKRLYSYKKSYLDKLDDYNAAMARLEPGHENYVDLTDETHNDYLSYYNNTYEIAVRTAYNTLVSKVSSLL